MDTNSGNNLLDSALSLQQSSNTTVRFFYENAGLAHLPAGIITHGTVFQAGELPSGQQLTATMGGKSVPVQVDVKTTHPDGSAKMAVLSLARPELPPGASLGVQLHASPAQSAPALDMASALAAHEFSVTLTGASGQPQVIDVLAALQTALAAGDASFWQSGPLATQARVEIPLEGSQRLVFDVTAFQGGGFSVEAQFNNDRAMEAVGGRVDYHVAVTMDGKLVTDTAVSQGQYQNWHQSYSSDGRHGGQGLGSPSEGWLNIRHDVAALIETGAVANYDLSQGVAEQMLQGWAQATQTAGWGEPLAVQGVTQYMPAGGARPDIGFTTAANTGWLMTQDPRAAAYALGQAEASSAIPWNMWDAKSGTWLSTDAYPNLWTDSRGGTGTPGDRASGGLTQQLDGSSGWALDSAHQPDLSYVPYLLTGSRWMLDNLQAQASWNIMSHWPAVRSGDEDLIVNGNQVRGAAWSLRQVDHAAWISPDGSVEKAMFTESSNANWAWLVEQIPAWTALQGEAHGWVMGAYGSNALPPWQQDYFASTTIAAATRGNADAMTFLEWQSNFLVGRFQQEENGFDPHDGAAYLIAITETDGGAPFQTWAEMGQKQREWGWSNNGGWAKSEGDYGQLAMATLAGIANLTGSAAATEAFHTMMAKAPPFTTPGNYLVDPTYFLAPPPLPGAVAPTPPPAIEAPPAIEPPPSEREPAQPAPEPAPPPVIPPPTPEPEPPPVVTPPPPEREHPPAVTPPAPPPADVPPPVAAPTPPPIADADGQSVIRVGLSQDAWKGNALFQVMLNGEPLGEPAECSGARSNGDVHYVEFVTDVRAGANEITVRFLNDAWGGTPTTDRNLYVESIEVDGRDLGATDALYFNRDAFFDFVQQPLAAGDAAPPVGVAQPPPQEPADTTGTTTLGTGPDTLRLGLSADIWRGDAEYMVLVNGAQLGERQSVGAERSAGEMAFVDVRGDFATNTNHLQVRFLNDAWGGTAEMDRNLYVESVALNGVDLQLQASLFTNSDAVFLF